MPTAKLTPPFEKQLREKLDRVNRGIEFDPLSNCEPAGMPRWMVEPFLREFVVTPQQTYLINEMQNEMRRVYTDGRDHPSAGRRVSAMGRRLDRLLGRRQARDPHEPDARRPISAHAAVLYGAGRDRRDLAEDRRRHDDRRRLDVRSAGARSSPGTLNRSTRNCRTMTRAYASATGTAARTRTTTVTKTETGTSDFTNFTFTEQRRQEVRRSAMRKILGCAFGATGADRRAELRSPLGRDVR